MKRTNNNTAAATENKPVKAPADGIVYNGEVGNSAGEDVRNVTASNLARKTRVKYALLSLTDLSTSTGEVETEYTRSNDKAEKLVADILRKQGTDMTQYRVVVTDLYNESAERRVYDVQDLLIHCDKCFKSEDAAREFAATLQENWSIRKVAAYTYTARAWVRDENGNDKVQLFTWSGTDRYSGLRSYTDALNQYLEFKRVCDEADGKVAAHWRVIHIEPESRERFETPNFIVITVGNLAKCSYRVIGEKDSTDETDVESEIIEG